MQMDKCVCPRKKKPKLCDLLLGFHNVEKIIGYFPPPLPSPRGSWNCLGTSATFFLEIKNPLIIIFVYDSRLISNDDHTNSLQGFRCLGSKCNKCLFSRHCLIRSVYQKFHEKLNGLLDFLVIKISRRTQGTNLSRQASDVKLGNRIYK